MNVFRSIFASVELKFCKTFQRLKSRHAQQFRLFVSFVVVSLLAVLFNNCAGRGFEAASNNGSAVLASNEVTSTGDEVALPLAPPLPPELPQSLSLNLKAISPMPRQASIEWTISQESTGQVRYGVDAKNLNLKGPNEFGYLLSHNQVITGLLPDTLYYFAITGRNKDGTEFSNKILSFRTLKENDPIPTPSTVPISATASELIKKANAVLAGRKTWYSRAGIPYIVLPDPRNPENSTFTSVDNLNGHMGVNVDNGYNKWPAVDGLVDLYQVTKDPMYLQTAIEVVQEYIDGAKDLDGDGFLDWWCPFNSTCPSTNFINHGHYEWRAGAGIGVIVATLADHPELTQFKSFYDKTVPFLERHFWEKWSYPSATTKPAGRPILSNITNIANVDMIGRIGFVAIALHKATKKAKYLTWINTLGDDVVESLLREYVAGTDSYIIRHNTYRTENGAGTPGAEVNDTSHANDATSFLTFAYLEGYQINGKLNLVFMNRLKNTLSKVIFKGPNSFAEFTDGSGSTTSSVGKQMGGWSRLTMFETQVRDRLIAWALDPKALPADGNVVTFEERVRLYGGLARALKEAK